MGLTLYCKNEAVLEIDKEILFMEILESSWGGKAEHGILTVDARVENDLLKLTAIDKYFNDYAPYEPPKVSEYIEFFEIGKIKIDRKFLYNSIKELLKKHRPYDYYIYRFDENDINAYSQL